MKEDKGEAIRGSELQCWFVRPKMQGFWLKDIQQPTLLVVNCPSLGCKKKYGGQNVLLLLQCNYALDTVRIYE